MIRVGWSRGLLLVAIILGIYGCKADSVAGSVATATVNLGQCDPGKNPNLKITSSAVSLKVGETKQVEATSSCGTRVWSSANVNVATVDASGVVTGISQGNTWVRVSIQVGDVFYRDSVAITVTGTGGGGDNNPPSVTGISTSTPLVINTSCAVLASIPFTVNVLNGASTGVTITATNHVGTYVVSGSSIVPTLKSPAVAGTDTITITSTADATKKLVVYHQVTICSNNGGGVVTVSTDTLKLTLCGSGYTGGTTGLIKLYVDGVQVPYTDVVYEQNGQWVSIDPSTGVVRPANVGTGWVKVSPKSDPTNYKKIILIVSSTGCTPANQPPGAVTVSPSGPITIGSGASCTNNTVQLTASKAVTWASSNTAIATVSSSGLVTSVSNASGSVTITATPTDGGQAATVTINVTNTSCVPPGGVTSVTVTPSTLDLKIGDQGTLTATVVVTNGASSAVTWSASDGCVSLMPNGNVVTVVANRVCPIGGVVVKATANADQTKSGSATVTVNSVATSCSVSGPNGATTYTVGQQVSFTVTCVVPTGVTVTPWWYSTDPSRATVLGATTVIYIGGIAWPAGQTATVKFIAKGTADICAQPYVQDNTVKGCVTVTIN